MNEINFAFQRKRKKKTFFPVLISFNDLSCDFFIFPFLCTKNFHFFLSNFEEVSVCGGSKKKKKKEDIRKSECLEIHEFSVDGKIGFV